MSIVLDPEPRSPPEFEKTEAEAVAMQLGILMGNHQCTVVGGGDPRVHSARMRDFLASTQSLVPLRAHRDRDGVRRHAAPR